MSEPIQLPPRDPADFVVEALIERCDMTEDEARHHVARWEGWEHAPAVPPEPISPIAWPAA